MAGAAGLEPTTCGFGDRCSSQLSYAPIAKAIIPKNTPGATRTHDTRFRKPLLYPLSYRGTPLHLHTPLHTSASGPPAFILPERGTQGNADSLSPRRLLQRRCESSRSYRDNRDVAISCPAGEIASADMVSFAKTTGAAGKSQSFKSRCLTSLGLDKLNVLYYSELI